MLEVFKLLIGIGVLILGIPIGNLLARATKEELKQGQPWFILLTWIGLLGGVIGLIIGNDTLMFTMFFIALVTSRSMKKVERKGNKKIKKKPKKKMKGKKKK